MFRAVFLLSLLLSPLLLPLLFLVLGAAGSDPARGPENSLQTLGRWASAGVRDSVTCALVGALVGLPIALAFTLRYGP